MEPSLLVGRKEMLRLLDMSLSKYKRLLKDGVRLPLPVMLGDSECWRRSEVEAFVQLLTQSVPTKKGDQT